MDLGEYTLKEFETYLRSEGVCHELTIPKIPEQIGVAKCVNRALIETARSMLVQFNLPH